MTKSTLLHQDEARGNVKPKYDIASIAPHFPINGELLQAEPYGSGHINDTFCAAFNQAGFRTRYIFQRINHNVFKNPPALMENIQRVTTHLGRKLAHEPDRTRRALTVIPARDGRSFYQDDAGNYWRV